ncbi:hypothetical protein N431DRAFT_430409 [Stipitochalara longipes BDJ]|nr:hypothetical protein N431DRAFT_430409 [Stipitochalara longipes BDJ]
MYLPCLGPFHLLHQETLLLLPSHVRIGSKSLTGFSVSVQASGNLRDFDQKC